MSAETASEATIEEWTDAIEESRLILDDDLDPADVAAEFDDAARETMADLCREAVLQVERDRSAVTKTSVRLVTRSTLTTKTTRSALRRLGTPLRRCWVTSAG